MTRDASSPTNQRTPPRIGVGTVLGGRWRVETFIGEGGMATVWAATHVRNRRRVALKVLRRSLSHAPETRARFLREGYVANRIRHGGAVTVLDDDVTAEGEPFLVMDLLEGMTLKAAARATPDNRLDPLMVAAVAEQVCDVLAAAHDAGIVHRDVKPDNVFLTRAGQVKLLDFGIAREQRADQMRITAEGSVMGTPGYMPVEQALGDSTTVGPRSDIWAVGATMFVALTGRSVHHGHSNQYLLLAAVREPAPRLASVRPDVHPALCAVVDRALAFAATDRFLDARAMQASLRAALIAMNTPTPTPRPPTMGLPPSLAIEMLDRRGRGGSWNTPVTPEPLPPSSRRRRKRWLRATVSGVVALAGVATALVARTLIADGTLGAPAAAAAQAAPPSALLLAERVSDETTGALEGADIAPSAAPPPDPPPPAPRPTTRPRKPSTPSAPRAPASGAPDLPRDPFSSW